MAVNRAEDLGPCPLCGRTMIDGPSVDRHHIIPRSRGGRDWIWIHRVCHKKIHSVLSLRDLMRDFQDLDDLKAEPEIAKFVRWVARKPPQWLGRHEKSKR